MKKNRISRQSKKRLLNRKIAAKSVVIGVATFGLGLLALLQSYGTIAAQFAPQAALRLDPTSPIATTSLAESLLRQKKERDFQRLVEKSTQKSLMRFALNPSAIRHLAIAKGMRGNERAMNQLYRTSLKVSRRDSLTDFWFIEFYAKRGNLVKSLDYYNILLRIDPSLWETLFGFLSQALDDPEVRVRLADLLKASPPWAEEFVKFSATTIKKPQNLSKSLLMVPGEIAALKESTATPVLLSRLTDLSPPSDLRNFYLSLPGADPKALQSLALSQSKLTASYVPIAWQIMSTEGVGGELVGKAGHSGVGFTAYALPGRSGAFARKALFLGAGKYTLDLTADFQLMGKKPSASASLLCRGLDGASLSSTTLPIVAGKNQMPFQVDNNCVGQVLSLSIEGAADSDEADMNLSNLSVSRR